MALDSSQLVVGANGHIYVAAFGATAPTDESASMPAGWTELGYATEGGVKFTDEKTIKDFPSWQNFYPTRKQIVARNAMIAFELEQWNTATVKLSFGGGTVAQITGSHYKYTPPAPETIDFRAMTIEWVDATKQYRLYMPKGVVQDNVATTVARTDLAILPITFGLVGVAGVDAWTLFTNDPAIV